MQLLIVEGKKVMDSRDVAKILKKRHYHVLRDINRILDTVKDATIFGGIYFDKYGREKPLYKLPYRELMILLTGYSIELRTAVIDRWIALEKKHNETRLEAKKTRNQFTDMLKEHGYTKPGHYIQTTVQMKNTLGITVPKDEMSVKELKKIRAAEAFADMVIEDQQGYQEVNPVCIDSCMAVVQYSTKKELAE